MQIDKELQKQYRTLFLKTLGIPDNEYEETVYKMNSNIYVGEVKSYYDMIDDINRLIAVRYTELIYKIINSDVLQSDNQLISDKYIINTELSTIFNYFEDFLDKVSDKENMDFKHDNKAIGNVRLFCIPFMKEVLGIRIMYVTMNGKKIDYAFDRQVALNKRLAIYKSIDDAGYKHYYDINIKNEYYYVYDNRLDYYISEPGKCAEALYNRGVINDKQIEDYLHGIKRT